MKKLVCLAILIGALNFVPFVAAASEPIVLSCSIEACLETSCVKKRASHKVDFVQSKMSIVWRYEDGKVGDMWLSCDITDALIFCPYPSRQAIGAGHYSVDRYTGKYDVRLHANDISVHKNGRCKKLVKEDRKF